MSLVATALTRIDPTRFRTIVLGGSRPPADRPPNTVTTYGMTETGSGVVYDGVPLDGVDVRIDADGQIRLRGPMLLRCYRDGTAPVDDDGWFPTGDVGRWLDDGRLHVEGRRGDLIISGGENIWPEAVEAALSSHPGVAEVLVRGVDDPEWGQVVEALVVPTGDAPTPGRTPRARQGDASGVHGAEGAHHRRRAPPHLDRQTQTRRRIPDLCGTARDRRADRVTRVCGRRARVTDQPAATPAPPSIT